MQYRPAFIHFVLAFTFLTILAGCRGSNNPTEETGISHAYFLKNSGGSVRVTDIGESRTLVETTVGNGSGGLSESQWKAALDSPLNDELMVVSITGGKDVSPQSLSTTSTASVFAFASAQQINGGINVSPLTDIIWRISNQYVQRSHINDSLSYLDQLASLFVKGDLDGDGEVTYSDVLAFNPNSSDHLKKLSFDFNKLCCDENSYVSQVLSDADRRDIEALVKNTFGPNVSMNQDSSISEHITVTTLGIGSGTVLGQNGEAIYEPQKNKNLFHLSKTRRDSYFLTAYPDPGSKILAWNGCSRVSQDKTQCELENLKTDQVIEIIFGYKETIVSSDYVNLRGEFTGTAGQDKLEIDTPSDGNLKKRLLSLAPGNYTSIFLNDEVYLIKVSGLYDLGSRIEITYQEAGIFDVIEKGTALFRKSYSVDDIESIEYPTSSSSSGGQPSPYKLYAAQGSDPEAIVLTAQATSSENPSFSGGKVWNAGGTGVEISGSTTITFALETVLNGAFSEGTKEVKLTPKLTSKGNFKILISGSLKSGEGTGGGDYFRKKIGQIKFGRKVFFFSFVPVVIDTYVDLYVGANGEVSAATGFQIEKEASIFVSIFMSQQKDWSSTAGYNFGLWSPSKPVADGSARLRGYMEMKPGISLYGTGGPTLTNQRYAEFRVSKDFTGSCFGAFDWGIFFGNSLKLGWETSNDKFFKKIGFDFKPISANLLSSLEAKAAGGTLNSCDPLEPGALMVAGPGIVDTVEEGDSSYINSTLDIRNTGGSVVRWNAEYAQDSNLTVQPDSGELQPGESTAVAVSFNNLGSTEIRKYSNFIEFQAINGESDGATPSRQIEIDVVAKKLSRPEITEAFRTTDNSSEATVTWSIDESDQSEIVSYELFQTKDPVLAEMDDFIKEDDEWERLGNYGGGQTEALLAGLTEERIFLVVQALGRRGQIVQSEAVELEEGSSNSLVIKSASDALSLSYDGEWSASATEDGAFGNVDWKGWFSGGAPTRTLSWHGPKLRYFADFERIVLDETTGQPRTDASGQYVTEPNFDDKIYQGGKLHSVAPGQVLGSAITRVQGSEGTEDWLVVIVNDGNSDRIYAKPNEPSPNESGEKPDSTEWSFIAEFPMDANQQVLSGGWFFNSKGTEAQAVRYEIVPGENIDTSDDALSPRRLKIELNGINSATISEIPNDIGSYEGYGIPSGEPVIAVDYDESGEKLLRLTHESILAVNDSPLFDQSYFQFDCYGIEGFRRCDAGPTNTLSLYDHGLMLSYRANRDNEAVYTNVTIDYLDIRTETMFVSMLYDTSTKNSIGEYAAWSQGNQLYSKRYDADLDGTFTYRLPNLVGGHFEMPNEVLGYFELKGQLDQVYSNETFNQWSKGNWAVDGSGKVISYEIKEFGPLHFLSEGDLNSLSGTVLSGENIKVGVR